MKQRLMLATGAIAVIALAVALWFGFVFAGVYNVAASEPHGGFVDWTLETISERSIARRAGELPAPLPEDRMSLLHGLEHYRAMCEVCHAAPGLERNELATGLNPRPPLLHRAAGRWSDAELFWIVQHGIKATGMPAFGATHGDEELLQIVAVVRRLPDMSPADYAALVDSLEASGLAGHHDAPADAGADAGHTHAPGTPSHAH